MRPLWIYQNWRLKKLYSILILQKKQIVAAQRKWNLEFPPPLDIPIADYWESNYRASFRSVCETKLQAFQFKLLHRILPCGKYLKNIRIQSTDLCKYCNDVDTLTHFFFSCPRVQPLWLALCNWSAQQVNIQLDHISLHHYMLGIPPENPQAKLLNYIILTLKIYIFRQKLYHDANLDLTAFLNEFRNKLKIEKHICALEGKAHKFRTWELVLAALG